MSDAGVIRAGWPRVGEPGSGGGGWGMDSGLVGVPGKDVLRRNPYSL